MPIIVRGPHVRADTVGSSGERAATGGTLGQIRSADLLPYLLCQADTAHFLEASPRPFMPLGMPRFSEPWTYQSSGSRITGAEWDPR